MNPPHVTHTAIHTQFPLYTTVAACPVAAVYGWGVSQNSIKTNSILQTPPLHFTPPLLGAKVQDNPLLNEREWRLRVRAPTVHPIQQPAVVRPSLGYAVNFHHLVPNQASNGILRKTSTCYYSYIGLPVPQRYHVVTVPEDASSSPCAARPPALWSDSVVRFRPAQSSIPVALIQRLH